MPLALVLLALKAHRVLQVLKVLSAHLGLLVLKALRVQQARREYLV
jgi:hypothetical protein